MPSNLTHPATDALAVQEPRTLAAEEPMGYIVLPSHTGCVQCGRVGLLKERDAHGLPVDAWWVTDAEDRRVNHGPFCSDYCAARWVKAQ